MCIRDSTGSVPATSSPTPSGVRHRSAAGVLTSTYSATDRPIAPPYTRSPTANPVASAPTSSTTPAKSLPNPAGKVMPNRAAMSGWVVICQSIGFSPAAVTRTRTSSGAACGSGISSSSSTSGPPKRL